MFLFYSRGMRLYVSTTEKKCDYLIIVFLDNLARALAKRNIATDEFGIRI